MAVETSYFNDTYNIAQGKMKKKWPTCIPLRGIPVNAVQYALKAAFNWNM